MRRAFRSRQGWSAYLSALGDVLDERIPEAGTPPRLDLVEAAALYQTLYWVARTAAEPTPACDLLHVTAAGWAAVPAVVHKALHGTPIVLTEHGVYLRESYLAAVRGGDTPGTRFANTRLARGLTRSAYAGADVICPVTDANAYWEMGLGIDPEKIRVLYNGLDQPDEPIAPPGTKTVVSVGRIDPLKDIHTLLRVAADTLKLIPDARVPALREREPGRRGLRALVPVAAPATRTRRRLSLHGSHDRPQRRRPRRRRGADDEHLRRAADVDPGGDGPRAAGRLDGRRRRAGRRHGLRRRHRAGDDHGLAMAVTMLLRNPELAERLGRRGHARLGRIFNKAACVDGYRELLGEMVAHER